MKKYLKYIILFFIVGACIKECLKDPAPTIKDDNSTKSYFSQNDDSETIKKDYSSYREACDDEAYDSAYEILEKMKQEFEDFRKNNTLVEKYIVEHVFSKDEIKYDHSNQEKYYGMVDAYISGLEYVYSSEFRYLTSKIENEDALKRMKFLISEFKTHLHSVNSYDDHFKETTNEVYSHTIELLLNELISQKNVHTDNLVLSTIPTVVPIEGERLEEGEIVAYNAYKPEIGDSYFSKNNGYYRYMSSIKEYNKMLDNLLVQAIRSGNKNVSKSLLLEYYDDAGVIYKRPNDKEYRNQSGYKDVYVKYTKNSKNAAKKKYDEAVKMGAFE